MGHQHGRRFIVLGHHVKTVYKAYMRIITFQSIKMSRENYFEINTCIVFKSKNDHNFDDDALKLGKKNLQRIRLKRYRVTYSSGNAWEEWSSSAVDFQIITEHNQ